MARQIKKRHRLAVKMLQEHGYEAEILVGSRTHLKLLVTKNGRTEQFPIAGTPNVAEQPHMKAILRQVKKRFAEKR